MAAAPLPAGLLRDVRNVLDVTWVDEATDLKLTELLRSGIAYLDLRLGAAQDYTVPGEARTLLWEYVRYARDEALDVFENNYLNRLTAARNSLRVSNYVNSLESALSAET